MQRFKKSAHQTVFILAVLVFTTLLVLTAVSSLVAANKASTAATLSAGRAETRNQILTNLATQELQLEQLLVNDNNALTNNQAETGQLSSIIVQLESSVNQLCKIDGCSGSPVTGAITVPTTTAPVYASVPSSPAGSTTPTTTRSSTSAPTTQSTTPTTVKTPVTTPTTTCTVELLTICVPKKISS